MALSAPPFSKYLPSKSIVSAAWIMGWAIHLILSVIAQALTSPEDLVAAAFQAGSSALLTLARSTHSWAISVRCSRSLKSRLGKGNQSWGRSCPGWWGNSAEQAASGRFCSSDAF